MTTESRSDTRTIGDPELRIVSTIVQLLAGAIKHHTLYPEDHSIAKHHINRIYENFYLFFKNNRTLHLDIGSSTILYDGEPVYQGKPNENDIAFLLGRDGMEWIEFLIGLELWEIQSLLRVINHNRRSDTENEGNITTALWEMDFPHIEYKTLDLMAMDLPLLNLSTFRVTPSPEQNTGEHKGNSDQQATSEDDTYQEPVDTAQVDTEEERATGLALATPGNTLWNLTEQEMIQLNTMVSLEENRVHTESTIGILFILLLTQNDRQEAVETLAFLQDRFLYCLQHHQFTYALQIIRTLTKIEAAESKRRQWICPLIHELINTISRPESLRDLEKIFSTPENTIPENELAALWALLQLLPSGVMKTLAPLSCAIDIQRFGTSFLALFEHFGSIDSHSLAAVARDINQDICLRLFPFICEIRTDQAIPVLTAMARHFSPKVRKKAFSLLVEWDEVNLGKLFPLIDDPDEEIQSTILSLAGKKRHSGIERRLRKYLEEHTGDSRDRSHILACYHALGKSGSIQSIPFLKECLFKRSSLGTLFATGGGVHKEGAARALRALQIPEAKSIIEEGITHIMPDVRAACRTAVGKRHD